MVIQFVVNIYFGCGQIIDCPFGGVNITFGCSPMLYHNCWPIFKFRNVGIKPLLNKNIILRFGGIEHTGTFMPHLSGQSGRKYPFVHNTPSFITSEGPAYIILHL
jgi:hypothetical protein